jgi:hypothetical protein
VLSARNHWPDERIRAGRSFKNAYDDERKRPASRTLRGWAIAVLQEAGAIKECEEHGWMQDRADPHARQRGFDIAREERPPGVSPQAAAVAIAEVLDSIGDSCPECPPS